MHLLLNAIKPQKEDEEEEPIGQRFSVQMHNHPKHPVKTTKDKEMKHSLMARSVS